MNEKLSTESVKAPAQLFDIKKGSRVRAHWFQANNPPSSLAGMQMKLGVTERHVIGTITHIWADSPWNPTQYEIAIQPDGGGEEVVVKPSWIKEVVQP